MLSRPASSLIVPVALALSCGLGASASGGIINWSATFQFDTVAFTGSGSDADETHAYGVSDMAPTKFQSVSEFTSLEDPEGSAGGYARVTATASTSHQGFLDLDATFFGSGFNSGGGYVRVRADVYFEIENIPHPSHFPFTVFEEVSGVAPSSGSYAGGLGPGLYHFAWDYSLLSSSGAGDTGNVTLSFEIPAPASPVLLTAIALLTRRRR